MKKILVAPLDWGLGHATRCIPLIRDFISKGHQVLIAADGNSEALLKKEFPELKFISLRGYRIRYSSIFPMSLSIFFQVPMIIFRIFREHGELKKIITKHSIDEVISDNRFGLWNKKIHSVFITHQIMIKCPASMKFLESTLYRVNKFFISKYNECWIPDDDRKLSGNLAHRYPLPPNAKCIGILSRWKKNGKTISEKKYDVIGIISGPEPYRSSFEKLLIDQVKESGLNALIVSGKPCESKVTRINDLLLIQPHLESGELFEIICSSDLVICRSGYSSIMDLATIEKDAILIPTPGQTEQVYLAEYLTGRKIFYSVEQKKFNLRKALRESEKYSVKNLFGEEVNLS